MIDHRPFLELLDARARHPERIAEPRARKRRPLLAGDERTCIIAADHPARAVLSGSDPLAMAHRRVLLGGLLMALAQPGVDGILVSPDIGDDLLLLDALHDKIAIGSMNRGGLAGAAWELDDRFTAYDADAIARGGLDGGKMLLRLDLNDRGSLATLEGCARAMTSLAARKLLAMIEPLPAVGRASGGPDLEGARRSGAPRSASPRGWGRRRRTPGSRCPSPTTWSACSTRRRCRRCCWAATPATARPRCSRAGSARSPSPGSRPRRGPRPALPTRRRRRRRGRRGGGTGARMSRRLHWPAGRAADGADPVAITPESPDGGTPASG